jgi:molybdenum cofactor synthesis domain-containing protein
LKWADNLISIDEALGLILKSIIPTNCTEVLPVIESSGRVLAEDVIATHDVPPFNRSAMDGYALNSSDTVRASAQNTASLTISGEIYAGDSSYVQVKPGHCSYIATGAAMPAGADAVIRIEKVTKSGNKIHFNSPVKPGENIAPAGEDIRSGEVVLQSGCQLKPARVGVLSSQGISKVKVYCKPMISVITTGEELAQSPEPLKPGQIYDVNNATLCSLIMVNGGLPVKLASLGDRVESLVKGFKTALSSDMVVVSGGSSVGQKDYMHEMLSSMGQVLFHGLNVKPGKPTLFAIVQGKPVLALPGYPTSCLLNAYLLLKPAVHKLARLPDEKQNTVEAVLDGRISASARRQFVPVQLDGLTARPIGKESGAITAIAHASGYITVEENSGLNQGASTAVTLF